jgi:plasmid stabilization system protein ParE
MHPAVFVSRRALAQVREAALWWKRNRPSAPGAVEGELAKAIDLIAAQPGIGARAEDRDLPGVRRIRLDRIGYHLYYSATAERIDILALWHVRRGSGPPL